MMCLFHKLVSSKSLSHTHITLKAPQSMLLQRGAMTVGGGSMILARTLWLPRAHYFSASRVSRQSAHGSDERNSTSSASSSSSSSTHRSSAEAESSYDQFNAQRERFYSHSFHEKGSTHKASSSSASDGHSQTDSHGGSDHSERVAGRGSATAQERRQLSHQWENAFFGRVHFEQGMHDRYAAAMAADEAEAAFAHDRAGRAASAADEARRPSEADMNNKNAHRPNRELFPDWPEDEEAPLLEFKKLPAALQAQYILNRLTMGERRVRYALDYGSLSMMYQLNLGERMINEAEFLLNELGWMNASLQRQIEAVKDEAYKVKYDYDLD